MATLSKNLSQRRKAAKERQILCGFAPLREIKTRKSSGFCLGSKSRYLTWMKRIYAGLTQNTIKFSLVTQKQAGLLRSEAAKSDLFDDPNTILNTKTYFLRKSR